MRASVRKAAKKARKDGRPDWLNSPAARRRKEPFIKRYRWWVLGALQVATWAIVVGIGREGWNWGEKRSFLLKDDKWFQKRPDLDGGADKFGHLLGMYLLSRGFTWFHNEAGHEKWVSVLVGGLTSVAIGSVIEVGDAYTARYGFSYTDILFNLLGTGFAVLQDSIPALEDLYSFSIFWFPSSGFFGPKNEHKQDFLTNYTGTKHFFHIHLAAIPYINKTVARYFRLDLAYWSRNFKVYDKGYPDNLKRVAYFGISVDFAQLVLDFWPKKWYRTSTAVFLKYVNLYAPFETGVKIVF